MNNPIPSHSLAPSCIPILALLHQFDYAKIKGLEDHRKGQDDQRANISYTALVHAQPFPSFSDIMTGMNPGDHIDQDGSMLPIIP